MRFKQYLLESLQKVYHALPEKALISILRDDRIEFVPNTTIEHQGKNEKFYYFSTMRNKSGKYLMGGPDMRNEKGDIQPRMECYVELDFDALKSVMKSKPVDYWEMGPKMKEQEERFWSDHPYIENVGKYIKSIHILKNDRNEKYIAQIYRLSWGKTKIPMYVYDKPQNFILGKNPIDIENIEGDFSVSKKDIPKEIEAVVKLFQDKKLTELEARFLKNIIRYPWGNKDSANYIENWLHRSMKTDDKNSREYGREFVEAMRKGKTKKVLDFLNGPVAKKSSDKFGMGEK